jgi:hypothetical protein
LFIDEKNEKIEKMDKTLDLWVESGRGVDFKHCIAFFSLKILCKKSIVKMLNHSLNIIFKIQKYFSCQAL